MKILKKKEDVVQKVKKIKKHNKKLIKLKMYINIFL